MNITSKEISIWWRELFRRRRVALFNTQNNREVWHTHISLANILITAGVTFMLTCVLILTLVGYTNILYLLPGYRSEAMRSHNRFTETIIKIDSMEQVIKEMALYTENISSIMRGQTPATRINLLSNNDKLSKELVLPSQRDSLLRAQMEGESKYNLQLARFNSGTQMTAPVDGVIIRQFNIAEQSYGVAITSAVGGRIMATQRGVVVLAHWSPTDEYVIEIMHSDNTLSLYRNIKEVIVERGDTVKAGEVIGYNGDENRTIEFEIWSDGRPIDPETHITF
ncbi:MAG: M23 family metallopeptidase [Rikenellaceae bacterium]